MLNLAEYRPHPHRLADRLPWAALVAPGVVLNKDGSFQRSLRFRGPDLDSATESELVSVCARLNGVLKSFGSGWALFFEAERFAAPGYPAGNFPDPASWLVDAERRAAFESGQHFESAYHLTLLWLPPADPVRRAERALIDGPKDEGRGARDHLARFISDSDRVLGLLAGILPELEALDDAATLSYLHATISTRRHKVAVPAIPMYLDAVLVDSPLTGGLEPMLGDRHIRTLTVLGFPNLTRPGILDGLNHLGFEYRWVTRFLCLDKTEATRTLTKLRRQWFAKRKSVAALLREVLTNEPAPLIDTDAENKATDADLALQALGGDHVAFGHLTATVAVWDDTRQGAADKLRAVARVIEGCGFATISETVNAVEAWLGSLPGHVYANVRFIRHRHRQPVRRVRRARHRHPHIGRWPGAGEDQRRRRLPPCHRRDRIRRPRHHRRLAHRHRLQRGRLGMRTFWVRTTPTTR